MRLYPNALPARSDLVDATYRVLLDAITDGSLKPGERITQEEIAEQLHVSRSPVLQALRLLKKDGFIKDAPGRGVQVADLDGVWFDKLYDVRGALDALAARLAANLRSRLIPPSSRQVVWQHRAATSRLSLMQTWHFTTLSTLRPRIP